jgi:hypothetical protein
MDEDTSLGTSLTSMSVIFSIAFVVLVYKMLSICLLDKQGRAGRSCALVGWINLTAKHRQKLIVNVVQAKAGM